MSLETHEKILNLTRGLALPVRVAEFADDVRDFNGRVDALAARVKSSADQVRQAVANAATADDPMALVGAAEGFKLDVPVAGQEASRLWQERVVLCELVIPVAKKLSDEAVAARDAAIAVAKENLTRAGAGVHTMIAGAKHSEQAEIQFEHLARRNDVARGPIAAANEAESAHRAAVDDRSQSVRDLELAIAELRKLATRILQSA